MTCGRSHLPHPPSCLFPATATPCAVRTVEQPVSPKCVVGALSSVIPVLQTLSASMHQPPIQSQTMISLCVIFPSLVVMILTAILNLNQHPTALSVSSELLPLPSHPVLMLVTRAGGCVCWKRTLKTPLCACLCVRCEVRVPCALVHRSSLSALCAAMRLV